MLAPIFFYSQSLASGKLLYELPYDDVSYAVDVQERVAVFNTDGFLGLVESLTSNPPHSPTTTLTGLLFSFFQSSQESFYLGNIVLSWFLSAFVFISFHKFIGNLNSKISYLAVGLFALSPVNMYVVQESRPDISSGVIVALTCLSVISYLTKKIDKTSIFLAFLICLSLISKLTFLPHTLFILSCSFLIGIFVRPNKKRRFSKVEIQNLVKTLGIACLLSAPVLIIEYQNISEYVIQTLFGKNKDVWAFTEYGPLQLVLEFTKPGWHAMGGIFTPGLLILISLAIFVKGKRDILLYSSVLLFTSSFIFIALLGHQNAYFFSYFHAMIVFSGILGIEIINARLDIRSLRDLFRVALVSLTLGSVILSQVFMSVAAYPDTLREKSDVAELADLIRQKKINGLFLTFTGPVNRDNLLWKIKSTGLDITIEDSALSYDLDETVERASKFKFVLVPNIFTSNFNNQMPSGAIQERLILKLVQNGFSLSENNDLESGRYYLLSKTGESSTPILTSFQDFKTRTLSRKGTTTFSSTLPLNKPLTFCLYSQSENNYSIQLRLLSGEISMSQTPYDGILSVDSFSSTGLYTAKTRLRLGNNCFTVQPTGTSGALLDASVFKVFAN